MLKYDLLTPYYKDFNKSCPLKEYPRPYLVRDSYINLNGEWDYKLIDSFKDNNPYMGKIVVPYCIESFLSGVRKDINKKSIYYHRTFNVDSDFIKDKTILHVDACDQEFVCFINGKEVGKHVGGYLPASIDISKAIVPGINDIVIISDDNKGTSLPYGKQRHKRGGIWYTQISGIWQSVWLESVNNGYIDSIKITPDIDKSEVQIEVSSEHANFNLLITFKDETIVEQKIQNRATIKIDDPKLWSPEEPNLYNIIVSNEVDKVSSHFAMRKISVDDKYFYLNNKRYFINGLLDQGYFSDGIYTPATYEAYKGDILEMKKLGFNALRKHIKIEPQMYYYYCDIYGMLILQDMVNVGKYSFIKDSALPFAFHTKKLPWINTSKEEQEVFINHSIDIVNYLYNFPCVVYYTIFNEGWGQFDGDKLYTLLKSIDNTRIYDSTSGWFKQNLSDVESYHIYFKPIVLKDDNKATIVSEFGGYSYKDLDHSFNTDKTFGYRKYEDRNEFAKNFIKLYEDEIIKNKEFGLAGAIYTQVSDVEDETNGILTYDRQINKLEGYDILSVMEKVNK